jgi:2Fe-2S ferredoxin
MMTVDSPNRSGMAELVKSGREIYRMPKVRFLPMDIEVEVAEGTAVLDAALNNNIQIDHNCGGNCACSTCHIIVEKGFETLNTISEDETDMLDEAEGLTEQSRLACQCKIRSDLVVKIPPKDSTWENDTF